MKLDSAKWSILPAPELLLHVHSRRAICGLPLCSLEVEGRTIGDILDPLKKRNSTFSGEFSIFGLKNVKFESSVDKWYSRTSQKIPTKIPPDLYYAPRVSHWESTFHFIDSHSKVLFSSVRNGHFRAYI